MDQFKKVTFVITTVFLLVPTSLWAWGKQAHSVVTEFGTQLAAPADFTNCHVTAKQLIDHSSDPDNAWRSQRRKHPNEPRAHFFHVDKQPEDWRTRKQAKDPREGYLVYRINDYVAHAKELRKAQKWADLTEHLYGLVHYMADITQPLHVYSDYDGKKCGLPGIHSQFETKMISKNLTAAKSGVRSRLGTEKIPALWSQVEFRNLVFDTAIQSNAKALRVLDGARNALQAQRMTKKGRKLRPAFIKKKLWDETGVLAQDQLALASRLIGYTLDLVCK